MVCKSNQCVDRGGGSPMTRTLAAGAVMSACDRTASGRPAPALVWPVCRGSYPSHGTYASRGSSPSRGTYASLDSAYVRLGSAYVRRASCPPAVRSCRLGPARPPLIPQRAGPLRPCQPVSVYRLYLYLLQWHAAMFFGCSFDPGRDVLCILSSPRRWLQWP
jgi:hypothetical protein